VRIGRLVDALVAALAGLDELPPEPEVPERAEALLARRRAAELERQLIAQLLRRQPSDSAVLSDE
jgi:hypothetical protein